MGDLSSIPAQLAAIAAEQPLPRSANLVIPTFNVDQIQPPTDVYVTTDDTLVINTWNSAPNQQLVVTIRFLLPDGNTTIGAYNYSLGATRALQQFAIPLVFGYMLAIAVNLIPTSTNYAQRGHCYVAANLQRAGILGNITNFGLFSDYVTASFSPSWPSFTSIASVVGTGALRSIQGTTPLPGHEISLTVPTNARWRIHNVFFQFQTSATVATRNVVLYFTDPNGNVAYYFSGTATQPASQLMNYNFSAELGYGQTAGNITAQGLPMIDVLQAWRIQTGTAALQAGDQYSVINYIVEEWIEPGT